MTILLKATLKLNEKPVQILEFSFCWSLSVKFNSKTTRDRRNLSTQYQKPSAQ